jgi:predicted nuclease of predicted toxin-antitoxin system
MQLYSDENFPLRTVEELRSLGYDVLTALEDGRANQAIPDEDVLSRANELRRTVLTYNRKDFKRLHYQRPEHAGIIACTEDPDRVGQAKRIAKKIEEEKDLKGKLIKVYRPSRS